MSTFYNRRKNEVHGFLGSTCAKCSTTEALQIDHVDPSQKSFTITMNIAWRELVRELRKCQLLCKPCHRAKSNVEVSGKRGSTVVCGTRTKYSYGCRCDQCRAANRRYYRPRKRIVKNELE